MSTRQLLASFLIGLTAGHRSMTAPAAIAIMRQPGDPWVRVLSSRGAPKIMATLALGEMVFDKLPGVPNRTAPSVISGRLLSGAICGAILSPEFREGGAAIGLVGTLIGTFAGLGLRRAAAKRTGIPDGIVALAEDATAVVLGITATQIGRAASRSEEAISAHVA